MKSRFTALLYIGLSLFAGLFHYFFQVRVSKTLDIVTFGSFSAWLAYLSICFSFGSFIQFTANFFVLPKAKLQIFSIIALLVIVILSLQTGIGIQGPTAYFLEALVGTLIFSFIIGQIQARKLFLFFGFVNLIVGAGKVLAFELAPSEEMAYKAMTYQYLGGMFLLVLVAFLDRTPAPKIEKKSLFHPIIASFLLSVISLGSPQIDIILMQMTQDASTLGKFAKVSLIYKAFFFFVAIFAQMLLPNQIQSENKSPFPPSKIFFAFLGLVFIGSLAAYLGTPILAHVLQAPEVLDVALWIGLSCLNIGILTLLYLITQQFCSQQNIKAAGMVIGYLVLEYGILTQWKGVEVVTLLGILVFLQLLLVMSLWTRYNLWKPQKQ